MNKKGFVVTSVLYPITILVTGVTAVFLSTTKTNNVINGMKLDVNSSVFDSVTCDCEAINKAIKTHSEKIKTIENTIEKVQTDIDSLRDYLNYGNAKANEILSGKTAIVQGQKVTGTMVNQSAYTNALSLGFANNTLYVRIPNGAYLTNTGSGYPEITVQGSSIANTINLPANKILMGTTILGVAGTATSDGNATKGQILNGQIAYVKGNKIIGEMKNWTGIPQHIDAVRLANGRFEVAVAKGYHDYSWTGNSYEYLTYDQVAKTIGLTADKIKSGEIILGIQGTYTKTSTPPTGAQILVGFTAWANGQQITGTMPNRGSQTNAVSTSYTNNTLNVRIPTGAYLTNTSSGYPEILVSAAQIASVVNIPADKVLKGTTILGVEGTMPNRGYNIKAPQVLQANGNNLYYRIPVGYYALNASTGYSEVYAPFADIAKAIGLTADKIVEGNTILGIQGTGKTGISTDDANATKDDIILGKTAYVKGQKVTGTIATRAASTNAVNTNYASGVLNVRIPKGAYLLAGGAGYPEIKVTDEQIKSAINLDASVIKKGVKVLGVTGTYEVSTAATATQAQILAGATAWVNGQKLTGTMVNYSNKTVTANKVAKNGTNVDITVPNTGYYDTTSKLQVPISTLQDTIGGGSGRTIDYTTIFTKTDTKAKTLNRTYTFDKDYDNVMIVISMIGPASTCKAVATINQNNGSEEAIATANRKDVPCGTLTSTNGSFTQFVNASTDEHDDRATRLAVYYSSHVSKGTTFTITTTSYTDLKIYTFDGITTTPSVLYKVIGRNDKTDYSGGSYGIAQTDSANYLFQFTGDREAKAAICIDTYDFRGNSSYSYLYPIVRRKKDENGQINDSKVITDYLNSSRSDGFRDAVSSIALFNNISKEDWFGLTTKANGAVGVMCIKLQ